MVNKQYRNRLFAARFIFEKSFPVMFPCSGCKTTNPDHFEESCIIAPDDDICSRCVRLVLRIEKVKNRVKSDLEVTIKAIDSKHMEVLSAIESADFKRKKMEFAAQHIGVKNRELQQAVAKQKRLREIWFSFDYRENDLLNQEIRTIRALDELDLFSIDDNGAEPFGNSAKISISDCPRLLDFDFSQFLEKFDFSSIPIFALTTFQK